MSEPKRLTRYRPMDLGYADGPQWVYLAEEVDAELAQLRTERDRLLIRVREYGEAMSNAMQTVFVVCPICGAMKEREIVCWRCDDDPDYAALTQREGGDE